ncbi:MAG: (S)-benzoin forming benzil reductase [Lentimicrobium sp.]|nr:(S)-benzoin forming benzil reductase [Lentimicrobium sp.]
MKIYIVTGASSGIGEAIARKLILERHTVFCISRKRNESLIELASSIQTSLWYFETDLGKSGLIPGLMNEIFKLMDKDQISAISLINNAGIIEPVCPAGNYDNDELQQLIHVNLLAPMLLSNEFIKHTRELVIPRSIVNISSGAAASPYAGWGPYCSSKAGLEMFTRVLNLEQKQKPHPVRVLSIAPGIVDTPMQGRLRNTNDADFPMKPRFEQLYQHNLLSRPAEVAEKIINFIFCELPGDDEIIDLRKL